MTQPDKTISAIIRGGGETLKEAAARQGPPREERQLERLRVWLSRPNWKSAESVMLLAGLDPELSFSEREGRWWLPGSDYTLHPDEIADRLERVRELRLSVLKPQEVIAAALAKNIVIPWLPKAQGDPICAEHLPEELRLAERQQDAVKPGQSGASPQSRGGKHRPDDEIVAIYVAAALHDDGVKPPRIVDSLKEMNLPGKRDAVGRWLDKIGNPKQGPGVDALLSCTGRTREELEGLRAKAMSRKEKPRSTS